MRSMLVVLAVLAGCGRSEPHGGEDPQIGQLCQAVMSEPQVKEIAVWPAGACLDLTYEPGAEGHAMGLHAALLEWAAAPGTWLCFNPPMPGAARDGRVVHVREGETGPHSTSLASVKYDGRELLAADVVFSRSFTFTHGMYLHTAGQLLGFQRTAGVESVINAATIDDVLPMLTPADLQSVAAVYPACR